MNQFLADVVKGLNSNPKYLDSKYFYDKTGDELFQKIMDSPEYYLTNCEMEIFTHQKELIAEAILAEGKSFDYVGFGPGDAVKSTHLLKEMWKREGLDFFIPIDISSNMVNFLENEMPKRIPGLRVHGLAGEYLQMLPETPRISGNKRIISFLGANIGNFKSEEVPRFLNDLNHLLKEGELVMIGFDLKKNPYTILEAYNDKGGITAQFNVNLLSRINRELKGDFNSNNFKHYNSYDPDTGACKSFLFSLKEQEVKVGDEIFHFEKDETIHMETSQKYSMAQIEELARICGYKPVANFFDSERMFVDVLWKV